VGIVAVIKLKRYKLKNRFFPERFLSRSRTSFAVPTEWIARLQFFAPGLADMEITTVISTQ
jgi:hypothetical protein